MRKYIDIIEEISDGFHFNFNASPDSFLNYPVVLSRLDEIEELWTKAFEQVKGDSEKTERLNIAYSSWLYLKQCATYDSLYVNGTQEQREQYVEHNKDLINRVNRYGFGVCVGHEGEELVLNESASPDTWYRS